VLAWSIHYGISLHHEKTSIIVKVNETRRYAYGMVSLVELAWKINEDGDGFLEKGFNVCLLFIQITMCLGMA